MGFSKELIFNSFYIGQVWWPSKNGSLTVSSFRGCGDLQRTESQQFLHWTGVAAFKEWIFNSFFFERVW